MICKICGKEIKGNTHFNKAHNISVKEYYDSYIKQENEGICYCGKSTKFLGLNIGYRKFCSVKCAQNDSNVRKQVTLTNKKNLLKNYGVENIQQIPIIREKTKKTCLKKYGNEYAIASDEIKQKISVIQKSKNIIYDGLIKTDLLIDQYSTGWYQKRKELKIEIILKGRYSYIKESDISKIIDYQHSELRKSSKEFKLANYIESIYNKSIIRNTKSIIKPYELDIYLPDLKLAIEYNGCHFHSIEQGTPKDYHLNKSLLCREKNIRLIHIYEFEDIEEQKQLLKDLIQGVDNYPKNDFNKNNLIENIPESEIIYKENNFTIYGAGKLEVI